MMELKYDDQVRVHALELAIKHATFKRGYNSGAMGGGQTREIPSDECVNDARAFEAFIHGKTEQGDK